MTHGHFDVGYSESTFSNYAFGVGGGGGGHIKEYGLYARENDDNSGRPLSTTMDNTFNWLDIILNRANDTVTFRCQCNCVRDNKSVTVLLSML